MPELGEVLKVLQPHFHFSCTVSPQSEISAIWSRVAISKYGDTVAAVIAPAEVKGRVILLPQAGDQAALVLALMQCALPELAPHLFPHQSAGRWVHRPEYELTKVVALQEQIRDIEEAASKRRMELELEIEGERQQAGYLHGLLLETGDALVQAVKTAITTLGFKSIIDSDSAQSNGRKREDLQLHDKSPTLLVEVKGIAGRPPEHEAMEVVKYLTPRMKEWGRTDVQGLSVINHQRHVPALERDASPFTDDLIINAREQGFGIMTAFDLFRLVRNFIRLGWGEQDVMPLLYRAGRIEPIPGHYEYVGTIQHFYPGPCAVTVNLEKTGMRLGDRIAYELPVDFFEQDVESLEIDRRQVQEASAGTTAGIRTAMDKESARKGTRVFRIMTPSARRSHETKGAT